MDAKKHLDVILGLSISVHSLQKRGAGFRRTGEFRYGLIQRLREALLSKREHFFVPHALER
jgi:hypothetical protein